MDWKLPQSAGYASTFAAMMPIPIILVFSFTPSKAEATEKVRGVLLLFWFLTDLSFVQPIPDSLDLARELGEGPIFSGWIISVHRIALMMAALPIWFVFQRFPGSWLRQTKPLLYMASFLHCLGMCLFAVVAASPGCFGSHSSRMLLASRGIAGVGAGVCHMVARSFMNKTCLPEDRPKHFFRIMVWAVLGLGLGPISATLSKWVYELFHQRAEEHPGEAVSILMLCMSFAVPMAVARLPRPEYVSVPSGADAEGQPDTGKGIFASSADYTTKRVIILLSIFVSGLKCVNMASLEVATSMILEDVNGWSTKAIGLAVGCSFLIAFLSKFVTDLVGRFRKVEPPLWLCVSTACSCIFTLSLFGWCADLLQLDRSGRAWQLLVSDALLYPTFFLTAMAEGIATEHALPSSRLFSVDTVSIYLVVLNDGSARFLGPPMGRAAVAHGGQSGYALQQLIICIAVFLGSLGIRQLTDGLAQEAVQTTSAPSPCSVGQKKEGDCALEAGRLDTLAGG